MVKDDKLAFGKYRWQVLDVKDGRALLITENIPELRWYHDAFEDVTWGESAVRDYLNGEFYERFSSGEKARIVTVTNTNPDNPWFRTKGGADTSDRIFLLSLAEVCTYFGDSEMPLLRKDRQTWFIDDANNARRQAKYGSDFHWWRLRSPGYYGRTAASVSSNGNVYVRGNGVFGRPKDGGGLRPALWLTC